MKPGALILDTCYVVAQLPAPAGLVFFGWDIEHNDPDRALVRMIGRLSRSFPVVIASDRGNSVLTYFDEAMQSYKRLRVAPATSPVELFSALQTERFGLPEVPVEKICVLSFDIEIIHQADETGFDHLAIPSPDFLSSFECALRMPRIPTWPTPTSTPELVLV